MRQSSQDITINAEASSCRLAHDATRCSNVSLEVGRRQSGTLLYGGTGHRSKIRESQPGSFSRGGKPALLNTVLTQSQSHIDRSHGTPTGWRIESRDRALAPEGFYSQPLIDDLDHQVTSLGEGRLHDKIYGLRLVVIFVKALKNAMPQILRSSASWANVPSIYSR